MNRCQTLKKINISTIFKTDYEFTTVNGWMNGEMEKFHKIDQGRI